MSKDEIRFWSKVKKGPGCWDWQTGLNPKGYGLFTIRGKLTSAHREAWKFTNGKIPKGLVIDHLCRNRKCMNPDHMEVVTNKENILRGVGITAVNARKTECFRGHEFTEENTYIDKGKWRGCVACRKEKNRKRRIKNKQEALKQIKDGSARPLIRPGFPS